MEFNLFKYVQLEHITHLVYKIKIQLISILVSLQILADTQNIPGVWKNGNGCGYISNFIRNSNGNNTIDSAL